jgi:hypothetical protein
MRDEEGIPTTQVETDFAVRYERIRADEGQAAPPFTRRCQKRTAGFRRSIMHFIPSTGTEPKYETVLGV